MTRIMHKFELVSVWMRMRRIVLMTLLCIQIAGCPTLQREAAISTQSNHTLQDKQRVVGRDYLISPGDQLEVIYHFPVIREDQYHLAIGDQVKVEFLEYPQFDRTIEIRPDGRITVPYEGDMEAAGLTTGQLADAISHKYSNLLRRPQSTVSLVRYGQQVRELKEAIARGERGLNRLFRVNLDGKISMPLLNEPLTAAGLTMEELNQRINAIYKPISAHMLVTAALAEATGNLIFVSGAVNKPGFYEIARPTSSLQAVGRAGGLTRQGVIRTVLWVTHDETLHPVGRLLDFERLMEKGESGADVLMRQGDVLFVPNQPLAKADVTDAYLWRMIPANLRLFFKPPGQAGG